MSHTPDLEALAAALKRAVHRPDDASDSDSSIGAAPTNRFNKLKRKSRFRSRGKLDDSTGVRTDTVVHHYGTKRRAVISGREKSSGSNGRDHAATGVVEGETSDEDDPYRDVSVEELLAPLTNPADLPTHPALSVAFRRQTISVLASQALETISTEHEHRVQLSRLLTAFLGDDPTLVMRQYEGEVKGTSLRQQPGDSIQAIEDAAVAAAVSASLAEGRATDAGETQLNGSGGGDGEVKVETPAVLPVATKAVTRGAVVAEEESLVAQDFISPEYDRNLGMGADEAEEARRLLQAALDRSEEYLRCMQRARMGLLKAERYRRRAYRWCKDAAKERDGSLGHGHMHV